MKVLILGGTTEAKQIAKALIDALKNKSSSGHAEIIYSIAGLVRRPELECTIIQGGFSQYSGLTEYLISEKIDCILDVTHPFAMTMSQQARMSAAEVSTSKKEIPYYSFSRPKWEVQEGDEWSFFEDQIQLLNGLALAINAGKKNVFYTNGHIDPPLAFELDSIAELNEAFGPARYIVRSAIETELPQFSQWVQAIGPFSIDDERALFKEYDIDLVVCKNSGGEATRAKLDVARELKVPVLMLQRPKSEIEVDKEFQSLTECIEFMKNVLAI